MQKQKNVLDFEGPLAQPRVLRLVESLINLRLKLAFTVSFAILLFLTLLHHESTFIHCVKGHEVFFKVYFFPLLTLNMHRWQLLPRTLFLVDAELWVLLVKT